MADPKLINVPGMGVVSFPGDMPDEKIEAVLAQQTPKQPSNAAVLGNSVAKGVAGIGDMIGNMGVNVVNLGKAAVGTLGHALGMKAEDMPDLSDPDTLSGWKKAMQAAGVITPENEPQGSGQRVLDMVGQTLGGGGVNPRAIGTNLAKGAIAPVVRDLAAAGASGTGAGVARELAGNIHTGNDDADRALKLAATLAGGMAPAAIPAAMGTAGERAAAATANMKPEDWALAKALQDRNNAAGAPPLTGFEAIQGVTGKNPKQQTIQRVAEQSDEANQPGGLTDMMAKRAAGNQAYFGKVADTISPAEQSGSLGGQLQSTAEQAIAAAQKARTAAVSPDYQQQRNSDYGAIKLQEAIPQIEKQAADRVASRNDARQQ